MVISKEKLELKEKFKKELLIHVDLFNTAISTNSGDWVVKGFIDIAKNIYTISVDTKVVSKIIRENPDAALESVIKQALKRL